MDIDNNLKLDDLELIKYLKTKDSLYLPQINLVFERVKDLLNTRIQNVFPEYTLHNTGHSFRIIRYMGKLVEDYTKLGEAEIALLILSALLHDVGMAVDKADIQKIKNDDFPFCDVKFSAMLKFMGNDEDLAMQEYIRRIHASLSGKFVRENLKEILRVPNYPNLDYSEVLALICEAHTRDYDWIRSNLSPYEVKGDYTFNPQFIAAVLRLGDILDIDGNRTPYNLYKSIAPIGRSDEEWKQHFIISNNEKIVLDENTLQKRIVFHGQSKSASIHRKLLNYISWVDSELNNAMDLVKSMYPQYKLLYESKAVVDIQTDGYTFSDYKMTLEFDAISSLLMGEKIYGSKSLGLRELIQNSIDACRIRQEAENQNLSFGEDPYTPKIRIILDEENGQVVIKDNGIGMSMGIIKNHFLNIGISYYNSADFLLKDFNFKPIGNYGIGFLSCFMLSEEVKVVTRHYKSKDKYLIELESGNEWTSLTQSEDLTFYGTEVVLNYENFMLVFENQYDKIRDFITRYFLNDGIDVQLINVVEKKKDVIKNSLMIDDSQSKNVIKIVLSDYLREIEGYVLLKRKTSFIKNFEQINFVHDLYSYDAQKGFQKINDFTAFSIDDFLVGRTLNYLHIPLVNSESEKEFLSGMRFTGNEVKEVIDKLKDKLTWISVLFNSTDQEFLEEKTVGAGESVFDDFVFSYLVDIGHSESCKTSTYIHSLKMFEGTKNQLYLPYEEQRFSYSLFRLLNVRQDSKKLFIRNVLINDFRFSFPATASVFEIEEIKVNVNSKAFIPDISRNNISTNEANLLNFIIGKAIHTGASKTLELDNDERRTLNDFTTAFYAKETEFEV